MRAMKGVRSWRHLFPPSTPYPADPIYSGSNREVGFIVLFLFFGFRRGIFAGTDRLILLEPGVAQSITNSRTSWPSRASPSLIRFGLQWEKFSRMQLVTLFEASTLNA
jgi:hypothetical protein